MDVARQQSARLLQIKVGLICIEQMASDVHPRRGQAYFLRLVSSSKQRLYNIKEDVILHMGKLAEEITLLVDHLS